MRYHQPLKCLHKNQGQTSVKWAKPWKNREERRKYCHVYGKGKFTVLNQTKQ